MKTNLFNAASRTKFLALLIGLITLNTPHMWGDNILDKLYLSSKNTPSGNTGWTFTDATANNANSDYWKMVNSTSVVTSPSFDISGYTDVKVSIKWQNFGTFNTTKCNATVKISTATNTWTELGKTGLTSASTTTVSFTNVEQKSSFSSAQIQISTPSADGSVGGRLFSVEITGTKATTTKKCTVTWVVNGSTLSTTEVSQNSQATLPTDPDPASYCGDKFMGWTTIQNYDGSTAPSPLITEAPTIMDNITYYAVFGYYKED